MPYRYEVCSNGKGRYWIEARDLDTDELKIKGPLRSKVSTARRALLRQLERMAVGLYREYIRITVALELADLKEIGK